MVIFRCCGFSSFLRPSTTWCPRLQAHISEWKKINSKSAGWNEIWGQVLIHVESQDYYDFHLWTYDRYHLPWSQDHFFIYFILAWSSNLWTANFEGTRLNFYIYTDLYPLDFVRPLQILMIPQQTTHSKKNDCGWPKFFFSYTLPEAFQTVCKLAVFIEN